MSHYVVTMTRTFGSGGRTICRMLSENLGIPYYDKDLIKMASEVSGISETLFNLSDEKLKSGFFKKKYYEIPVSPDSADYLSEANLFGFQAEVIRALYERENCVIVGRCADFILNQPDVIRVFTYASREASIRNVCEAYSISEKEAVKLIESIDKERAAYYKHITGHDWDCARNYDLCIDTSNLSYEKCVEIIKDYIKIKNK